MEDLNIKYRLDDSQARATVKSFSAEVREAGKSDAAAAKEAAAAQKAAQKEVADAAKEKAKAQEEANRLVNSLVKEAARRGSRREDAERAVKQSAAEKTRAEREHYRKLVADAKEATRIEKMMAAEAVDATASTAQLAGGLLKASAAMVGFQSMGSLLSGIVTHFDKIRMDAFHAAEDVLRMRGAIRELAALRGDLGKTGPTMAHVLGISAQTLQTPEEAQHMEEAGLGIGELAIGPGGKMTRAEFEKSLISAGKMQTMEGGPAEAYGAMVGQLPPSSKENLTADQMQGKMNRMFQIQQPGGFKNFGQAAQQYAKIQPLIQSGVLTEEQGMGLLSAMSVSSPEESASMVDQFVRATMSNRMRERGMKVPEGVEFQKSADYMKSIGADKMTDPIEIGKTIAADLKAKEAEAAANGKKFDQYGYLQTHGLGQNQQDLQTIMLFAGLQNRGTLGKIQEAENAPLQTGVIDKTFEERRTKDLFLQGRAGQIQEQLATAKQGMAEEPMIAAQRGVCTPKAAGQNLGLVRGMARDRHHVGRRSEYRSHRRRRQLSRAGQHRSDAVLEEERQRVGAPVAAARLGGNRLRETAENVRNAGGDVTRGTAEDLRKAAADLREAAKDMREAKTAKPAQLSPPLRDAIRQASAR